MFVPPAAVRSSPALVFCIVPVVWLNIGSQSKVELGVDISVKPCMVKSATLAVLAVEFPFKVAAVACTKLALVTKLAPLKVGVPAIVPDKVPPESVLLVKVSVDVLATRVSATVPGIVMVKLEAPALVLANRITPVLEPSMRTPPLLGK